MTGAGPPPPRLQRAERREYKGAEGVVAGPATDRGDAKGGAARSGGRGEALEDILGSTDEVAEGVATSRAIAQLIDQKVVGYRRDLKFPILFGVAAILDGKLTPRQGLEKLMQYPLRVEDFDAPKRDS